MKKKFHLLLCLSCFLVIGDEIFAQAEMFRGKTYLPMPLPVKQDNYDPYVENNFAIDNDGNLFPTENSILLPDSASMSGSENIFTSMKGNEELFDKNFTNLSLISDPSVFPYRRNVKLFMDFPSGGSFVCSGALIDSKHVLTAGHCVHQISEGGWAEAVFAAPAYNNGVDDFYGDAEMVSMLSWTGWTQNESYEHDMALVELDRPVGAITSWFGYGYNDNNSFFTGNTFHNPGYPGESPYNGQYMYYWYGNFDFTSTPNILYHNNYSYGGQSGSNSYYKDANDNRYVYACLSHGNNTQTGQTRLTGPRFTSIQNKIGEHTPNSPDLVPLKVEASPSSIQAGATLSDFSFIVHNYSTATFAGNITVDIYLSTNSTITTSDNLIGTKTFTNASISPKNNVIPSSSSVAIPANTNPGSYYIGVIITNQDADTDNNNTVGYDSYPIQILAPPPSLSVSPSAIPLPAAAGTYSSIQIVSNINWSISGIPSWASISPSTGSAGTTNRQLNYNANNSTSSRSAILTFSGSGASQQVQITQSGCTPPTTPTLNQTGTIPLCNGQSTTLTITNPCSGCTFNWSNGQTGTSITVSTNGNYTATAVNNCGTSAASQSATVSVGSSPGAPSISSANGNTVICPGQSIMLTASNVCNGCTVHWSNTSATGTSISVSSPGTYTAYVSGSCGNSVNSNQVTLTLGALPTMPTIISDGNNTACPNDPVLLTATNICSGCNIVWSYNNQQGTTLSATTSGNYFATATNQCGTSQASNTISVNQADLPSTPTLNQPASTVICPGSSITLNTSNICTSCTINWQGGQTQTGPTLTATTPGSYWVTASNACGTSQPSSTVNLTQGANPTPPTINAPSTTTYCSGASVPLTLTNICNGCNISWSNGGTTNPLIVSSPGTYFATANNACGTSQPSNSTVVTEVQPPPAPVLNSPSSQTICEGQTITLEISNACSGCAVTWSNGQTGNPIVLTAPGTYFATMSNSCGQSQPSNSVTVSVMPLAPTPIISPSDNQLLCQGQQLTLTVTNICAGCNVVWSNGQQGPVISVNSPGNFSATMSNNCGSSQSSSTVSVSQGQIPPMAIISPAGTVPLCNGASVTLTAVGCDDCSVVNWSNGQMGQTINVSSPGSYTATFSNNCGTGQTSVATQVVNGSFIPDIEVNNQCYLAAPNGTNFQWSYNGVAINGANTQFFVATQTGYYTVSMTSTEGCDGTSDPLFIDGCATASNERPAVANLSVFPNPTNQEVNFSFEIPSSTRMDITLSSVDRKVVKSIQSARFEQGQHTLTIDLNGLTDGVYLYRIVSEQGTSVGKLVVGK